MKILLVEDDDVLAGMVAQQLRSQNYVVDRVADGLSGWSYASSFGYDLLILDLILPQMDGLSLCQRLRAEGDTTPILLLTAEDRKTTKIQALDSGADDYMVKPFDMAELIARSRALLRRGQGQASPLVAWGELLLNSSTGEVSYGDRPLQLTAKEYKFLELLLNSGSQVISMAEVLEYLWSSDEFPVESTVRSHLRRLRHKLQQAGAPPDLISTLHGRGYYLKAPPSEAGAPTWLPPNHRAEPQDSDPGDGPAPPCDLLNPSEQSVQSAQSAQYLEFLNHTWQTAQTTCLEKLNQLEQSPRADRLALAHSLAGTLGMFGLGEAVALARQLEVAWRGSPPDAIGPEEQLRLQQLRHWIEQTHRIEQPPPAGPAASPALWILGDDAALVESLSSLALDQGFTSRTFADWQALLTALAQDRPTRIVASLGRLQSLGDATGPGAAHRPPLLAQWKAALGQIPLVILGDRDSLTARRQALKLGGQFWLRSDDSLEALLTVNCPPSQQPGGLPPEQVNVMVVDDDPHWLTLLLHQLQPHGFSVTTLADPQSFWQVLQSVKPDALVLDAKIPEIDGFELCQIVRHDPQWQALPILFLSILNDLESQQLAFAAGADDYLFKPVGMGELAHRICSRLQRVRAVKSA